MSDEADKWREERKRYLGITAEDVTRIVEDARQALKNLHLFGIRIEQGFRRNDADVLNERIVAIIWLADELAKRPALTVHLDPRANACATVTAVQICGDLSVLASHNKESSKNG